MGTLSQSDYRWGHSVNQITGACRGAHAGDARAGGAHAGDVHTGGVRAGVVGTLSQSDYRWGHSANQITGAHRDVRTGDAHAGGARIGGVHTWGVHTGDVHAGGACAGVVGTLSQSDYRWGHSANQITGAHRGCTCRECVHRGCACRGCVHRGCTRGGVCTGVVGTLSQTDYRWGHSANQITGAYRGACAGGAHAGGTHTRDVHTGGVHAGVVGTLSQSDYRWGHSANQITQGLCARMCVQGGVCRGAWRCMEGCAEVRGGAQRGYHWLPLATIDLVGDNGEF